MVTNFKQYFFNPLCFRCGSFFVEQHLFCEMCFDQVISSRLNLKQREIEFEGKIIKHLFLFEWVPGESDLISALIYQLKNDRCALALNFYAQLLVKQAQMLAFEFGSYNCVLPLPGSSKKSVHSIILAHRIALDLGIKFAEIFKKKASEIQQKQRSLWQRRKLKIHVEPSQICELITELGFNKLTPIYVDDVLTTGSTLKASIEALGPQNTGCVMTLFYRPSSQATIGIPNQTSLVVEV